LKTMAKKNSKPQKYSYVITSGHCKCLKGSGGQTIVKLWETGELTAFHDSELAQATKEINAILSKIEKKNKDPERKLSFIQFQNRHLLVWAHYDVVGPDDDDATIIKALRLKVR
jgi:hypothetical protein